MQNPERGLFLAAIRRRELLFHRLSLPISRRRFQEALRWTVFGILPVLIEQAYQQIPNIPGISKWSDTARNTEIASIIQVFFSLITSLPLHRHPVSEIYANDPADLRAVLDSSDNSPVFLISTQGTHIVTSKVADGWQSYQVRNTEDVLTWTFDRLLDKNLNVRLVYNAQHEPLPSREASIHGVHSCTDAGTFVVKD